MSRHVEQDLLAYVHRELDGKRLQEVEDHLETCEACRRELESVRGTHERLQSLAGQPASDRLWSRIESALDASAATPEPAHRRPWITPLAFVGLAGGVAAGIWLWSPRAPLGGTSPSQAFVVVTADAGTPQVAGTAVAGGDAKLYVGQELTTGSGEVATIKMKDVGDVKVMPETNIALLRSTTTEQRLDLRSGSITAKISAPPKIFFVETPLATAVDLGCEYTLTVNKNGEGKLSVISGWVELQSKTGKALVPAEAQCAIYPKHGVGVPYFSDAAAGCVTSLSRFETGDTAALDDVLRSARKEDALTVWHLLARTHGADRERVYDRLAQLAPPPKAVTKAAILGLDEKAMLLWRDQLAPTSDRTFW